ncbi:MAG: hypothetical protein AB8G14_08255 [Ilumatobacter sp.]
MATLSSIRQSIDARRSAASSARPVRAPSERGLQIGADGDLGISDHSLSDLVGRHGSPVHVIDMQAVDANVAAALDACSFSNVYSSYKTNPIPALLHRLHVGGVRAEVISPFEWWLTRKLDVDPASVIYNGPAKSRASLIEAAAAGVGLVNINSPGDLDHIVASAEASGHVVRSGVRVSLPHMWGGQFGIDGNSATLIEVVERAIESTWIDLVAVHAHSGFPLTTSADVTFHVESVLAVVDRIHAATGWSPSVLDLGGSTTCPSLHPVDRTDVISLSNAISLSEGIVQQHFASVEHPMPQLAFEPGKALTGDTQLLLATVIHTERSGDLLTARLDVGVGLAEPLRDEPHDIFNASNPSADLVATRLVGPGTTGDDSLGEPVFIAELAVGNVVAIMDTGAYFVPFSRAASHLRPAVVALDRSATPPISVARAREDAAFAHRHDRSPISQ